MTGKTNIKVYFTSTCPHCKAVKSYLTEKGIKFIEYDVLENQNAREEMIRLSGQMGVPVTIIDEEVVIGFDHKKLELKLTAK